MVSRVLKQILPLEIKPLKLLFMPPKNHLHPILPGIPGSSRSRKALGPTLREPNVGMGRMGSLP